MGSALQVRPDVAPEPVLGRRRVAAAQQPSMGSALQGRPDVAPEPVLGRLRAAAAQQPSMGSALQGRPDVAPEPVLGRRRVAAAQQPSMGSALQGRPDVAPEPVLGRLRAAAAQQPSMGSALQGRPDVAPEPMLAQQRYGSRAWAPDRPVKPSVGKVAPDPGNPDNAQKPDGPPRSAFSVSGPSIAGRSPFGAAIQVLASPATVYPSAAPMAATNRGARHGSVCRSVGCPVGR